MDLEGADVPATVVDTRQGDVVIFDHRTKREWGNWSAWAVTVADV